MCPYCKKEITWLVGTKTKTENIIINSKFELEENKNKGWNEMTEYNFKCPLCDKVLFKGINTEIIKVSENFLRTGKY